MLVFLPLVAIWPVCYIGRGLCDQTPPGEFGHKDASVDWRLAPCPFVFGLNVVMCLVFAFSVGLLILATYSLLRFGLFAI
jgi:hypothetical protein